MTQMPPSAPPPPPAPVQPAGSKGLAVTALVLGICALIPLLGLLPGIAAVIVGIVALSRKRPGRGMATTGIVLGGVGILVFPMLAVGILMPTLARARSLAQRAVCRANLNQLGTGYHLYYAEHEAPPPDLKALEALGVTGEVLTCPSAKDKGRDCDYFVLFPARGADAETIMACDLKGNHEDGRNVLYHEGAVVCLDEEKFQAELALPRNAAFAKALKQAEGP